MPLVRDHPGGAAGHRRYLAVGRRSQQAFVLRPVDGPALLPILRHVVVLAEG